MSDGVARLLVTEHSQRSRFNVWLLTASYANWIEGRENAHDTETWLVTVFNDRRDAFLDAARRYAVTVEEIEHDGERESYKLLVGEPGAGWVAP